MIDIYVVACLLMTYDQWPLNEQARTLLRTMRPSAEFDRNLSNICSIVYS